ncbi:hypothetical protein [Methylocella silvestris]|uniref:hypothetical protein n=1 Tax=Methylocella silvestris TaxID=199596 RepID=UPI001FE22D05|nr:hypothetical protein [Methylocella silvestris]
MARRVALYYAWSRPGETGAPLSIIENRFPALFESRRMLWRNYRTHAASTKASRASSTIS